MQKRGVFQGAMCNQLRVTGQEAKFVKSSQSPVFMDTAEQNHLQLFS